MSIHIIKVKSLKVKTLLEASEGELLEERTLIIEW